MKNELIENKENNLVLLDEDYAKGKIYFIHGKKVMLDSDLAEIYGYSTKDFNGQVYDAHSKIIDILNTAKDEFIIIDSYADKKLLDIIKYINKNIIIITS